MSITNNYLTAVQRYIQNFNGRPTNTKILSIGGVVTTCFAALSLYHSPIFFLSTACAIGGGVIARVYTESKTLSFATVAIFTRIAFAYLTFLSFQYLLLAAGSVGLTLLSISLSRRNEQIMFDDGFLANTYDG